MHRRLMGDAGKTAEKINQKNHRWNSETGKKAGLMDERDRPKKGVGELQNEKGQKIKQ